MLKKMTKKAEMAIGTLIIFIAMILVAAIAAGVIIQTATALQNKALLTGERAKSQVGTSIQTILVYGEDGRDKQLESFFIKIKLSPGSDSLKFGDMLLAIDTDRSSLASIYGERPRLLNHSETWHEFDSYAVDFNDDDRPDYVRLYNDTHLQFNISNNTGSYFTLEAPITFADGYSSLSTASPHDPVYFETFSGDLEVGEEKLGTFHLVGHTTSPLFFSDDVLFVVGTGASVEQGAYAVDYLLKGSTWKDGYLQRGDVVKLAVVAPHAIGEDEQLTVRFIPKTGNPRTLEIVVPDLVSSRRVYIFN